ncbi:MAG: SufB/SufD family protein, partial [Sphingobacterium sp.]
MSTIVENSLFQQLTSTFQELESSNETTAVRAIRAEAFARFQELGFPTLKNEDWKYTNIQHLVNKTYLLNQDVDVSTLDLSAADIPLLDAHRIVLINGQYVLAFSTLEDEIGLKVKPIEEAQEEAGFQKHFAKHADKTGSSMVALNTALHTSGIYLEVAKNKVLSKPIQIVHVSTGSEDFFAQTRNLYVLSTNSQAEIIENFISVGQPAFNVNNKVTEIVLEDNAKMQHYYLQLSCENSHYVNHTEVYQSKDSLYNNYNCNFPGVAFVRNDINVRLDDENVESHLYGINLLADKQFVDNHTVVDHMKPHCESYEWYKNIPQDQSTAVFNGKIFVREDAQKTN